MWILGIFPAYKQTNAYIYETHRAAHISWSIIVFLEKQLFTLSLQQCTIIMILHKHNKTIFQKICTMNAFYETHTQKDISYFSRVSLFVIVFNNNVGNCKIWKYKWETSAPAVLPSMCNCINK